MRDIPIGTPVRTLDKSARTIGTIRTTIDRGGIITRCLETAAMHLSHDIQIRGVACNDHYA